MRELGATGVPTAWEYAAARRACQFRRLHEEHAKRGEPSVFEECGLCGSAWVVGWKYDFVLPTTAADVWVLIYEHCLDHVAGIHVEPWGPR